MPCASSLPQEDMDYTVSLQEEAEQVAKKIFKNGEDNKDWYCEHGEIESPTVEEIREEKI